MLLAEWGEQDSNLRRHSQWVYSPSPLTTRTSPQALGPIDSRGGVPELICLMHAMRARGGLLTGTWRESSASPATTAALRISGLCPKVEPLYRRLAPAPQEGSDETY